MNGRAASLVLAMSFVCLAAAQARAQLVIEPTPLPTVTADNESWYLNGDPITHAGNLYYPTGAQVYFNANEMVRSGFFMGVPLYTRTTFEPYSIVYVPLEGGRLQPYQRPRTGELTGTAGSVPSTLPRPAATVPPRWLAAQAAGPPSQTAREIPVQIPRPNVTAPSAPPEETPVGTTGRAPMHVNIGDEPQGTQSMFIEYDGRRWYPTGPPQRLDPSGLVRRPDFHGFDVWAPSADAQEILIPITRGSDMAVTYSLTKPPSPFR